MRRSGRISLVLLLSILRRGSRIPLAPAWVSLRMGGRRV